MIIAHDIYLVYFHELIPIEVISLIIYTGLSYLVSNTTESTITLDGSFTNPPDD